MRYVGILKSGDNENALVQHIPFDQTNVERLTPHGSVGTSVWLSGFIRNLSPTFNLYLNFYNSSRELQEIAIPPLTQLDVKNQNCERFNIKAKDLENNTNFFGVFEYVFNASVAENDLEASELLYLTDHTFKDLTFEEAYKNTQTFSQFQMNNIGSRIRVPFNRQVILLDFSMGISVDQLPPTPITDLFKAQVQATGINPLLSSTKFLVNTILTKYKPSVELIGVNSGFDYSGHNVNISINGFIELKSIGTNGTPAVLQWAKFKII